MKYKYITPKKDYVFKKIFNNEKEGYLKDFVEALLKEDVPNLEVLQNTILDKESENNKCCILDVVAKTGNTYVHLEMQNKIRKDFEGKVDMYDKKESSYLAKAGEYYNDLKFRLIHIWILGENLDNEKVCIDKICRVYVKRGKIIEGNSETYIIELKKIAKGEKRYEDKLWQWLYFLGSERIDETMEKIMEINPKIKMAVKNECSFSDEDIEFFAKLRKEKAEMMWREDMQEAEEKGVKRGIEQGLEQEKIRIIWSMYKNKFDIKTICLVLNLTQEYVENILNDRKSCK